MLVLLVSLVWVSRTVMFQFYGFQSSYHDREIWYIIWSLNYGSLTQVATILMYSEGNRVS